MQVSTNEKRRYNPKPRPKARYDKQLICVTQNTNNNVASTTVYPAAIFPSVIMGILISGGSATAGATTSRFNWALVVAPQGTTLSVITSGNAATMYAPEAMVLAFGSGTCIAGANSNFLIKTKTGRKVNVGDVIWMTFIGTDAVATTHNYVVQFFLKT